MILRTVRAWGRGRASSAYLAWTRPNCGWLQPREARRRPSRAPAAEAVHFTKASANRKLAPVRYEPHEGRLRPVPAGPFVSTTFATIQGSCPSSCRFKRQQDGTGGGCFADAGFTRIAAQQMDVAGVGFTPIQIAQAEAEAIDRAFSGAGGWRLTGDRIPQDGARGGRDLRIHVGGDCQDADSAAAIAGAAMRWRARGGGAVWTYTHGWREIPRDAWGPAISVLASVEIPGEIAEALERGYPAALVVAVFPAGDKAFHLPGVPTRIVPCPAETGRTTCASCRLCIDRDLVQLGITIAFQAHGPGALQAIRRLPVLR